MPAKGRTNVNASIFLAKVIGPMLAVIGASILLNPKQFRSVAQEIMRSPALVFVIGHIALPAGIATVLVHNVWVLDWPVIITILGWAAAIGGAIRILAPQRATKVGREATEKPGTLPIAGGVWLVIGLVLSYFGFR